MRYIGTHMHLHSCYEVMGSMHGHCMQARNYGLEAVWFTDHDTFMGARRALNGYQFESGLLYTEPAKPVGEELKQWIERMKGLGEDPDPEIWRQALEKRAVPPPSTGFRMLEDGGAVQGGVTLETSDAYVGRRCMRMTVQSEGPGWERTAAEFIGWKKRMNRSLIADVSLGLAFRLDRPLGADRRVVIEFAFSQQPPDLKAARLIYCAGDPQGLSADGAAVLPVSLTGDGIWQYVILPVSRDAERHVPGGLDNAFQNMVIRAEARSGEALSLLVDQFNIWEKHHLQDLMLRQRELGKKIGEQFGVRVYVTTEVSMAGHHKNCFSEAVPIMDYPGKGYHITHEEAVRYLQEHGAVYAFNHPFMEYAGLPLTREQQEKIVSFEAEKLARSNCHGAQLIEVGFPEGRFGFSLKHFVELWDRLGLLGVYITGYGDSDNHRCDERWADGNNFAAYIAAAQPEEDQLCEGMLKGNLYSADPAGTVRLEQFALLETKDACMGCIVYTDKEMLALQVKLTGCGGGMELRWVDDGIVTERVPLDETQGTFRHLYRTGKPHGLCRVEVFGKTGRCLLLSNPIYFSSQYPASPGKRDCFTCME